MKCVEFTKKGLVLGLAMAITISPMVSNITALAATSEEAVIVSEEETDFQLDTEVVPNEGDNFELDEIVDEDIAQYEGVEPKEPSEDSLVDEDVDETEADTEQIKAARSERSVITSGRLPNQPLVEGGMPGAAWTIYDDGVLEVEEGFVNWTTPSTPWPHDFVYEIFFTGPITAGTSLSYLFSTLWHVTTIEGLEYFDTSQVTNMQGMFAWTPSLTSLDISTWDTSNVDNMSSMFAHGGGLISLDLSNWDTSSVTDMSAMFSGEGSDGSNLTNLNVSNWDTSNVENMSMMFTLAENLKNLDVSTWDTSNVTNMFAMFSGTSRLTNLDLSNWDTRKVVSTQTWNGMNHMFSGMTLLSELVLGQYFEFRDNPALPNIQQTELFTGYWQNVGNGTVNSPTGSHILTSQQLINTFDGQIMADTWVWQSVNSQQEVGRIFTLNIDDF